MDRTKPFQSVKLIAAVLCITFQMASCGNKVNTGNSGSQNGNIRADVLQLEKTIELPVVKGRIDHMSIDAKDQILYVSALGNNSIEAVDLTKGVIMNSIKDIDEPQGVIYVPGNNTICVSSGGSGDCIFYDVKSFTPKNTVNLGSDADNLRYDPEANLIFAGFGDGGIAIIDALNQNLISKITFAGHPEAFTVEKNTNKIYVNLPSSKSVAVLDYKSGRVVNSISLYNASSNFPIAEDELNHNIIIGCRRPSAVIIYNTLLSKEIARFDVKDDADDIYFDPVRKLIYISCGEGFLQVFKQDEKDTYRSVQDVETRKGARTSLFVPELNKIFVPAPRNGSDDAAIYVYKIVS